MLELDFLMCKNYTGGMAVESEACQIDKGWSWVTRVMWPKLLSPAAFRGWNMAPSFSYYFLH